MATCEAKAVLDCPNKVAPVERAERIPAPIDLLGMPIHPLSFAQTVKILIQMASGDSPKYAVTANVDHVIRYARQPEVRSLYTKADLVVADGMPLVWASWILGTTLPERVAGSDLMPTICAEAEREGLSVFLLGGAEGAAEGAARVLTQRHPKLKLAGYHVPPFGFEKDAVQSQQAIDAVRNAKPDILFVGLGSPKQENWIVANRDRCGAKLSIGVGITFSFVAGHIARAPRWMQKSGFEWVHRMIQEPGRLCKRYLIDDMPFVWLVLRQFFRGHR